MTSPTSKPAFDLPTHMPRPRLLEALSRSPIPPITLIVAPPGYGKTTLASQWCHTRPGETVWISLTNEHNTPERLLRDLARAIGPTGADGIPEPTLDALLGMLRQLADATPGSMLVLDDYHAIESQDVHQLVSALVSSLPPELHLVILSRSTPPLPLARRRMQGALRELWMQDLSFTEDEVTALSATHAVRQMDMDDVTTLTARTEGWIAGIRLALSAMDATDASRTTSIMDAWRTQQSLDEYVIEEVLETLPAELRDFILRTAFLPHLDPDLCDHVLQSDRSAALIAEASRRLAFVRPASGTSPTLSYHALFAESAMRISERHVSPADRQEGYRRAAEWFEWEGHWEAALEYAVRAEDWESAIRYARVVGGALMTLDISTSRRYWLEKLPLEHLLTDDDLARWYITALQYTGRIHEANGVLEMIRPRWATAEEPKLRGYLHSCEAFTAVLNGDDGLALRHLYSSLAAHEPNAYLERLHAWAGIIELEIYRGTDEVVNRAFRQARICLQNLPSEQAWGLKIHEYNANYQAMRGDLSSAMELYERTLANIPAIHDYQAANIHARRGEIFLEWDDLDAALQAANQAEDIVERTHTLAWHSEVMLTVARVRASAGDLHGAWRTFRQARVIQESGGGPTLRDKVNTTEAWLNLVSGKERLAQIWASMFDPGHSWRPLYFGDLDPRVTWVRCAITAGQLASADDALRTLVSNAKETSRWAELVSFAMWQAVVRVESGDEEGALEAVRLALQHGRPGGFVRSFRTPGYNLTPFVSRILPRLEAGDRAYLAGVLHLVPTGSGEHANDKDALLSLREREVLQLVAGGLVNQEVGDRLFISERTVKKHLSNIFRKLDTPNRAAAVSRALELGLLEPLT